MTDQRIADDPKRLDHWRLCDALTVKDAALLAAGHDPSEFPYVENWQVHEWPMGYEAARSAILNALRARRIDGVIARDVDYDETDDWPIEGAVNALSLVEVDSLVRWLASRGMSSGFFFPGKSDSTAYLDPGNSRYAPKLAAAVRAWEAVTDPAGKHPKQALTKWLREHAVEFGLTDDDGKPNETGIEEIAKVANWQPGGGAPRTPG